MYPLEIHNRGVRLFKHQTEGPFEALRSVSSGLETALFLVGRDGIVLFANETAKTLFGFQEMEDRTILAVTLSHHLEQLIKQAAQDASPRSEELSLRTTQDLAVIARAWPNPSSPKQVFLSIRDVTEVRRLERVRQDFVANVSHEIKTPLTLIRAMAEVLADVEQDDRFLREKYLHQIIGEVDRLSALVDDLLILSCAEGESIERRSCDLAAIVNDVVLQMRPKAIARGLVLEWTQLNPAMILANPDQIRQVALNLIDNAINYTSSGKVSVEVASAEARAILRICDTGIGIPSEDLPRIFERFYRVDKSRSRSSGGTGLGLSIAKHIVEAHGGVLSITSALHQGSEFVVSLEEQES